ncbi:MAG TPA: enoyl-CoA hydratase/isomerase family protein, partial [Quisquiliibacterium sp.]|nr:enoyl-CoA hydratase/isomerase family protein [Quisquiliibacterium sp.]
MSAPLVEVRDEAGLRWIRLQRPEKVNALNAAMMHRIAEALSGVPEGTTMVVLSGEGPKGFCAGADISEFSQGVEQLAGQEHALVAMIDAMSRARVPVCVLAHGRTFGAGGILLTLADAAIAADDLS